MNSKWTGGDLDMEKKDFPSVGNRLGDLDMVVMNFHTEEMDWRNSFHNWGEWM